MTEYLQEKSAEIREKTIDYHRKTQIPHIGCGLSIIEILTTLYYGVMKFGNNFILSKGHASAPLYVILNEKGLIPSSELYRLEEHPTLNKGYGIDATTGSLGHGLSIGAGMALANRQNRVYVLIGDGECDEGQIWEAARIASKLKLKNLIAIIDCNGFQGFKESDRGIGRKFFAFGWDVIECDGHDCESLFKNLNTITEKPLVILAKTIKCKGVKEMEKKLESHYFKLKKIEEEHSVK